MIKNITNFGRDGVADWFLQRITAVILFVYVLWLTFYCYSHSFEYGAWRELFDSFTVQVASLFALVSLLIHAWIGMWTIATDYIKPPVLRITFEVVVILALGAFLLWGVHILWS